MKISLSFFLKRKGEPYRNFIEIRVNIFVGCVEVISVIAYFHKLFGVVRFEIFLEYARYAVVASPARRRRHRCR